MSIVVALFGFVFFVWTIFLSFIKLVTLIVAGSHSSTQNNIQFGKFQKNNKTNVNKYYQSLLFTKQKRNVRHRRSIWQHIARFSGEASRRSTRSKFLLWNWKHGTRNHGIVYESFVKTNVCLASRLKITLECVRAYMQCKHAMCLCAGQRQWQTNIKPRFFHAFFSFCIHWPVSCAGKQISTQVPSRLSGRKCC